MTVPWGHSIGKNMAAGSIVCDLGFALEYIFEGFKKIDLGSS